jgi:hypothetical protein
MGHATGYTDVDAVLAPSAIFDRFLHMRATKLAHCPHIVPPMNHSSTALADLPALDRNDHLGA